VLNKIRAIIWDFGNILASFDHLKACRTLATYCRVGSPEWVFEKLWAGDESPAKLLEIGRLTPQQFFNEALRILPFAKEISFQEFSNIWSDVFWENYGISEIIDIVRPEIKQCICSNTDPIHWTAIEQLQVMKEHFSDPALLTRSYISGTRKPDIKIYRDALATLQMGESEVDHVLYIEDTAIYQRAFQEMGGNVLPYDCTKDDIVQLNIRLYEFGVLMS